MIDHSVVVLSGIIPGRIDNLLYALQHLQEEHFRLDHHRNMFTMLERYFNLAGDILPKQTLSDLLERQGVDAAKTLLYEELYTECFEHDVPDHAFRYSVDALQDLRAKQLTGETITASFEILERGLKVEGTELKGHSDARQFIYSELARIDKLNNAEASPEGDMRGEGNEILQDYADRKSGKIMPGIKTGISAIDYSTSGFQPGELCLICAYTGEGKSMLTTQTSWHAVVREQKNVFFATSETVRKQVKRRIYARHSREPQFGYPQGLNTTDIKNGTLTPEEEKIFAAVVEDFDKNPSYGKLYLAQVPRGATLGFMEARLSRQAQNFHIDLAVVDYLALLKPDRKRQSSREEYNDIIKDAKVLATSFNDGQGVPLISPWAMSQSAFKEALRTGEYQLANLAETSEAEKSSDCIIALLRQPDAPKEAKVQFLKLRDGEIPAPFTLELAYHCAYLGEKQTSSAVAALLDDSDDDLMALI